MSIKGKQIGELMNKASATAPDVTRPLKVIGDGNMLDGVKNIFNYALKEGEKSGFVKRLISESCSRKEKFQKKHSDSGSHSMDTPMAVSPGVAV